MSWGLFPHYWLCVYMSTVICTSSVQKNSHTAESVKRSWLRVLLTLQWRHNEHDGISGHQRLSCLLNRLFRRRSKKTSKLCVTGLYVGNSPVTGEFHAPRASNAENVSNWWHHHKCKVEFHKVCNNICNDSAKTINQFLCLYVFLVLIKGSPLQNFDIWFVLSKVNIWLNKQLA